MKSSFIIPLLLLIAGLVLTSCYKDDLKEFENLGNPEVEQEWAVPLIYDELTMDYWVVGAPQVTMEDTATIELPSLDSDTTQYIVSASFKGYTENTFPLDGNFQIYFLDASDVITDSLFSQTESVIVAPSGSGDPGISEPMVVVNQAKYQTLSQNKKMIFRLTLNTASSPTADIIYAPFKFTFKVGVKTTINIQL